MTWWIWRLQAPHSLCTTEQCLAWVTRQPGQATTTQFAEAELSPAQSRAWHQRSKSQLLSLAPSELHTDPLIQAPAPSPGQPELRLRLRVSLAFRVTLGSPGLKPVGTHNTLTQPELFSWRLVYWLTLWFCYSWSIACGMWLPDRFNCQARLSLTSQSISIQSTKFPSSQVPNVKSNWWPRIWTRAIHIYNLLRQQHQISTTTMNQPN